MSATRRSDLDIAIPKLEPTLLSIDGFLNENMWNQAALTSDFTEYIPTDGRPAEDQTRVLVWYGSEALYIGIEADEVHGEVRSTLADRDKLDNDDRLVIVLDTYDDQRSAFAFIVNPIGQQADGMLRDVSSASSFGVSLPFSIDENPDFVFTSQGRLTEKGFVVEIEIPFKSLRFGNAKSQNWGFNVLRKVQHSDYWSSWSGARLGGASFLAQNGSLTGLSELTRGRVLDINPEIRGAMQRGPDPASFERDITDPLGLNARYGLSSNMVINATLNPDFSQIEADVAQINYDPRRSVSFPEKRPFFLDGIEMFSTPTRLIYTRSIANPLAAVKLAGKTGSTTIAALSAIDNSGPSIAEVDASYINAIRLKRDLGGQNSLGVVYTDRMHGDWANRVFALDGNLIANDTYSIRAQTGFSSTTDIDGIAPMWNASANVSTRKWSGGVNTSGYHADFDPAVGFLSRGNQVTIGASAVRTFYGKEGAFLERSSFSVRLTGAWEYQGFFDGDDPEDIRFYPTFNFQMRGGWNLNIFTWIETFGYPGNFFTHYYLKTDTGFEPYKGVPNLFNIGPMISLSTPQFNKFSGSVRYGFGRDPNYDEWADANIRNIEFNGRYTPTDQLRFEFRYDHQQHFRASDKSLVSLSRVPRLKIEYQITPTLFVRFVGQYRASYKDALRDDSRTDLPVYFQTSDGSFVKADSRRSNNMQADFLMSYRPTPGTVVFIGYGTAMSEMDTYRFRDITRRADGFFMKLSYLFRM
ncbi:MAG: carbohydrate binding family 9 domain-containing protein [Bacteroidetes Order II. Incertae sedis bacterium]|nr:carbohydrate binding family 9 domain-containing protein [Bacteroidetes Order II. bacterium]